MVRAPGSLTAFRQALMRVGDQSTWSAAPLSAAAGRGDLADRSELLQVVPRRLGGPDVVPTPSPQADEADRQCESFGEQQKPSTGWNTLPVINRHLPERCRPRTRYVRRKTAIFFGVFKTCGTSVTNLRSTSDMPWGGNRRLANLTGAILDPRDFRFVPGGTGVDYPPPFSCLRSAEDSR